VPITAGVGTQVRCQQLAAGDYDQYVREARATGVAGAVQWAATTTGTASILAADSTRVSLLIQSYATGTVYLRFDTSVPTTGPPNAPLPHWYLAPGDRWEVPVQLCQLAVSAVASSTGGYLVLLAGLCA